MYEFTGNEAGTGGLVTFKDSRWLKSIVLAHQPHFINQPAAARQQHALRTIRDHAYRSFQG
jgi:oleate hydratase